MTKREQDPMKAEKALRKRAKRGLYVQADVLSHAFHPEIRSWERDDPVLMDSYRREVKLGFTAYLELARLARKSEAEAKSSWSLSVKRSVKSHKEWLAEKKLEARAKRPRQRRVGGGIESRAAKR